MAGLGNLLVWGDPAKKQTKPIYVLSTVHVNCFCLTCLNESCRAHSEGQKVKFSEFISEKTSNSLSRLNG